MVKMSIMVLCVMTYCGLASGYQRLGGKYYVHLEGEFLDLDSACIISSSNMYL